MGLFSSLKQVWHDDLASNPDTHAWVLSLYRAGEFHPQTVQDYFPTAAVDDAGLREQLRAHRADEARHVVLYDHAIAKLGQETEHFTGHDVFNCVIRAETGVDFAIAEATSADLRAEKVAHFLAHAHFLEARVARSLELHLEASERAGRPHVTRVVASVYADELKHVDYTLCGVRELLPKARAEAVIAQHRRGEQRANLAFSARQVRHFLARFRDHTSLSHRALFLTAQSMMELAHVAL